MSKNNILKYSLFALSLVGGLSLGGKTPTNFIKEDTKRFATQTDPTNYETYEYEYKSDIIYNEPTIIDTKENKKVDFTLFNEKISNLDLRDLKEYNNQQFRFYIDFFSMISTTSDNKPKSYILGRIVYNTLSFKVYFNNKIIEDFNFNPTSIYGTSVEYGFYRSFSFDFVCPVPVLALDFDSTIKIDLSCETNSNAFTTGICSTYHYNYTRYNTSYYQGYNNGYEKGTTDGQKLGITLQDTIFSFLEQPIKIIKQCFDFEVFGVNIGAIAIGLLGVLIVAWCIKRFI